LFTRQSKQDVFYECSVAEVMENPRVAAPNRIFYGLCALWSVLPGTTRQGGMRQVNINDKRSDEFQNELRGIRVGLLLRRYCKVDCWRRF